MKIKIMIEGKQEDLLKDVETVKSWLVTAIKTNLTGEFKDSIEDPLTHRIVTEIRIKISDAPILSFSQDSKEKKITKG
jgi:hypothetical protein